MVPCSKKHAVKDNLNYNKKVCLLLIEHKKRCIGKEEIARKLLASDESDLRNVHLSMSPNLAEVAGKLAYFLEILNTAEQYHSLL